MAARKSGVPTRHSVTDSHLGGATLSHAVHLGLTQMRIYQSQNQGATRLNLIELNRSLRQLRLGGIAAVLETRLH
jgi:hypothetical protein